jgi:hypothetical protein
VCVCVHLNVPAVLEWPARHDRFGRVALVVSMQCNIIKTKTLENGHDAHVLCPCPSHSCCVLPCTYERLMSGEGHERCKERTLQKADLTR